MLNENPENHVRYFLVMDQQQTGFTVKVSQLNRNFDRINLWASRSLDSIQTSQLVGFVRFMLFEGDLTEVYLQKNLAIHQSIA